MRMPYQAFTALLLLASAAGAKSPYLLSLDFETDTLGMQPEPGSDTLVPYFDVNASAGAADFGDSGFVQQAEFTPPTGPFTVEARIRPRDYGPLSTRFISDLVNTETWDNGSNQGFNMRLGGGYLYPVLPVGAYVSTVMYEQSQTYNKTDRASMSRCLGELDFATKDGGTAAWLEAFTDRCVDLHKWTYFAAVWDGKQAHVYLNGLDATDKWRPNGAGSQPYFNPTEVLTVGARYGGKLDSRHYSGSMDFIRILDTAMSDAQVLQRYLSLPKDSTVSSTCHGEVIPLAPLTGEYCDSGCTFRIALKAMGSCDAPGKDVAIQEGDSVDIEFSDEPDFAHPFLTLSVGQASFRIPKQLVDSAPDFDGPCYWRGRLRSKSAAGSAARRASSQADLDLPDWGLAKPFLLSMTGSASIRAVGGGLQSRMKRVAGGYMLEGLPGAAPAIFRIDGRIGVKAVPQGPGSWFLPIGGNRGVYLVRTGKGIYRIVL